MAEASADIHLEDEETGDKLYLVLTDTKKFVSSLITGWTGERYNHASVSFRPDLRHCYSFNMARNGPVVEDATQWPEGTEYAVYELPVGRDAVRRAWEFTRTTFSKASELGFNYLAIAGQLIGRPIEQQNAMICSQFVERVCEVAGHGNPAKPAHMLTPGEAVRRPGARFLTRGLIHRRIARGA